MNWKSFGMGVGVGVLGMLLLDVAATRANNEVDREVTQKLFLEEQERGTKMTCKILRDGLDGHKASAEWVREWQEAMKCRADWKF